MTMNRSILSTLAVGLITFALIYGFTRAFALDLGTLFGSPTVIAEVEPNGTLVEADAALPIITSSTDITGAITPTGDLDIFRLSVAVQTVVNFEVFDSSGTDCTSANIPASTTLTLLDSAGTTLKSDTTSGIGVCSSLNVPLAPGTYYIRLNKTTAGTIAAYVLKIHYLVDQGSETEPNDSIATANPLPSIPEQFIFGDRQVISDSDFYAVTLSETSSLRIETVEGDNTETCESNGIDSFIRLFNSSGVLLVSDDDDGRGFCSQIDGRGAVPVDAAAKNLAPGTYFIQVNGSGFCSGAACQFNYRLVVQSVPAATPSPSPTPTPTPTPSPTPITEVQFSAASYIDDESQTAVITVTRTGSLAGTSSVDVVLTDGTATGGATCSSGVDYVYTGPVTLNFAVSSASQFFNVPLCGDLIDEGSETVNLSLTDNVGADIGSPDTAVLLINDTASQFRNAAAIDMFLGNSANPYPSTINVSGGPTAIGSMRVTLYDVSHFFPDHIDILLVGPNGAKYVLMGDTGGPFGIDVDSPVTLSFTDVAAAVLPDSDPLTTGTFKPTSCETPVSNFPSPAPVGPYLEPGCVVARPIGQTLFGAFGLSNPMGDWHLYVRDDNGNPLMVTAIGSIAGGWGIEFLPPTAAGVDVSGRVLAPDGRGLRNATVTMTDSNGIMRSVVTSSFGYYKFEGVPVGDSFVISVNSRNYRFVPRVVVVTDTLTDVDFVGLE